MPDIDHYEAFKTFFCYCPQRSNVFTSVCDSVQRGRGSLSRGSLSKEVSVHGVSVHGGLCLWISGQGVSVW